MSASIYHLDELGDYIALMKEFVSAIRECPQGRSESAVTLILEYDKKENILAMLNDRTLFSSGYSRYLSAKAKRTIEYINDLSKVDREKLLEGSVRLSWD